MTKRYTWISVLVVVLIAGFIVAAQNFKVGYSGPQGQGDIIYTKASDGSTQLRLGTTSSLKVDTITGGTAQVIAGGTTNNAILGANAVGVQVLECGTSTQGVAIAYGTVYTTAPKIVCTYQVDSGADTAIEIQSKNTTNFTITATAAKNIDWIAVGIK